MAKNQKAEPAKNQDLDEDEDLYSVSEEAMKANAAEFASAEGEALSGGFDPYLKPVVGQLYKFTPLMIDGRDPSFIRHVCVNNGKTLMGQRGPVNDADPVEIKTGDNFTLSDFKGLPFMDLIGLKVLALCTERRKLGPVTKPGPDFGKPRSPMYVFQFKLDAGDMKTFKERRTAAFRAAGEAKQLAAAGYPAVPVPTRAHDANAQQTMAG